MAFAGNLLHSLFVGFRIQSIIRAYYSPMCRRLALSALFCQHFVETARSIDGTVLGKCGSNHCFQFLISLGVVTFDRCRPRMTRYGSQITPNTIMPRYIACCSKIHASTPYCFGNCPEYNEGYAAAFFRISRSSVKRATAFFNRFNSSYVHRCARPYRA